MIECRAHPLPVAGYPICECYDCGSINSRSPVPALIHPLPSLLDVVILLQGLVLPNNGLSTLDAFGMGIRP